MGKGRWGSYLKGAALGKLGFCTSWAVDVHGSGQQWVEIVEVDLKIDRLEEAFRGKRIVHISDLHCSLTVSSKYLGYCIERVNQLDADIVVLTGDYVTHDYHGKFSEKVVDLVAGVQSRHGVYACLGNHDYGVGGIFSSRRGKAAGEMVERMRHGGINVLRNECGVVEIDGKGLWLVGLGDLIAEDFDPEQAFAGVDSDAAVITLAHNPAAVRHLNQFFVDAVMCGHTHGVGIEWRPAPGYPIVNRRTHYSGMYHIGGKKLYVNRGLGRLGKTLFNARPEITVFSLC